MKRSFPGKEEYLWQILLYVLYLEAKKEIDFEKQSLRGHIWFNYHSRDSNKNIKSEPSKGEKEIQDNLKKQNKTKRCENNKTRCH